MAEYDPNLARMLVTLINAQEQELSRIARVLHDDVGQTMSAAGLQLDVLRMDLEARMPEVAPRTSEIQQLLEHAIDKVRGLSNELNPAVAEKAGFQFAMERLVGRYRERFSGSLRLMVDLEERLSPEVSSAMYKIADQALANAVRHARCDLIEVLVKPTPRGTVLEVRDHGEGFELDSVRDRVPGLGLLLMEYYASQAGIRLTVESLPSSGTVVRADCVRQAAGKERKSAGGRPPGKGA